MLRRCQQQALMSKCPVILEQVGKSELVEWLNGSQSGSFGGRGSWHFAAVSFADFGPVT